MICLGTKKTKIKMKKYIIAYTIRNTSMDYMPFYEAIKVNFPEHRHIMENAWVINSDKTAQEIVGLLKPYLRFSNLSCDMLFVSEINKENVDGMLATSYWPFITDKEKSDDKKGEEKMG